MEDKLYVVTVYNNPLRYRSRKALFLANKDYIAKSTGVIHYVVELAFGNQPYAVTDANNPRHIRLRTEHELWHKESIANAGIARLPEEAKYIALLDGDIKFTRDDWAEETIHQLQYYDVVQMWSHAHELGPTQEPLQTHCSFLYCWVHGIQPYWKGSDLAKGIADPHGHHEHKETEEEEKERLEREDKELPTSKRWHNHRHHHHHHHHYPPYFDEDPSLRPTGPKGEIYWHPGFAWAWRKEALQALGGLIDWAIMGAGDHHMAMGYIGEMLTASIPKKLHANYMIKCKEWQERALHYVNRNIGYVPMTVIHYWHGKKVNRNYWGRWDVLMNNDFDPDLDLKKDTQGIWQLTDRNWQLRDDIRGYFRSRDEDDSSL